MPKKVTLNIDKKTTQQIKEDLELCKVMTDIRAAQEVLELTNRLIDHQELLVGAIADSEHMTSVLKGKLATLKEFMRTSKDRYRELSILEYNASRQ